MKIKYLLLLTIALFITGCSQTKQDDPLYTIDENVLIQSSQDAYDYSFCLNEHWEQTDKSNTEKDCYQYTNKINSDTIYIFKNKDTDNNEFKEGMAVKSIKPYISSTLPFLSLNEADFSVDKQSKDYVGELKFLHEIGMYKEQKYQAIYFESNHFVPSVSGKNVANCIIIIYQGSDEQVAEFISNLENTIQYN